MDKTISKTFLITDTHWEHSRIITDFGFRPDNFGQIITNNWQNTVKNEDIVFHLGDVTWGSQDQLKNIMDNLPGTKILIRGKDHYQAYCRKRAENLYNNELLYQNYLKLYKHMLKK